PSPKPFRYFQQPGIRPVQTCSLAKCRASCPVRNSTSNASNRHALVWTRLSTLRKKRKEERNMDRASSGAASGRSWRLADFPAHQAASRISHRTGCRRRYASHNNGRTLCPIPRLIKFQSLLFARSRLRLEIVNPPDKWRKAHENRFRAAARFQSENRSAIIKEIELHVTPATVTLVLTFVVAIRFT